MEFSLSLRVEENRIRALLKGERPNFSCFLRESAPNSPAF